MSERASVNLAFPAVSLVPPSSTIASILRMHVVSDSSERAVRTYYVHAHPDHSPGQSEGWRPPNIARWPTTCT